MRFSPAKLIDVIEFQSIKESLKKTMQSSRYNYAQELYTFVRFKAKTNYYRNFLSSFSGFRRTVYGVSANSGYDSSANRFRSVGELVTECRRTGYGMSANWFCRFDETTRLSAKWTSAKRPVTLH